MKLQLRGDIVFIRPDKRPAKSESGLELVYDRQETIDRGVIVALGDGPVTAKGVRLPHLVRVGERVVFPPDAGRELFFERETIFAVREEDILAVVE